MLCGLFGYSRQSYYKRGDDDDFRPLALEPILVERVKGYREGNPRLWSVKLWVMLKRQFEGTGCFPGRDAFVEMLRRNGLLVKIKRRRHYTTTDSNHNHRRYPNLIKGIRATGPNRVWVSDITYVETEEGVCHLSLVTDLYSHKIVGWSVGPTLDTAYPLEALRMALSTLPEGDAPYLIHHSDRGCQYCSNLYVETLRERKIQISMTQSAESPECSWLMCWDEEGRLQSAYHGDDRGQRVSWYGYDGAGARAVRMTGEAVTLTQNGVTETVASLTEPVVYPSPLVTLTKRGYTKHYFEGERRICSAVGGGFSLVEWDTTAGFSSKIERTECHALLQQLEEGVSSAMRCVDVETSYVDAEGIMRMLQEQHQKMHDDPDFINYVPSEEGVYINVHEFRMLWDRFAR